MFPYIQQKNLTAWMSPTRRWKVSPKPSPVIPLSKPSRVTPFPGYKWHSKTSWESQIQSITSSAINVTKFICEKLKLILKEDWRPHGEGTFVKQWACLLPGWPHHLVSRVPVVPEMSEGKHLHNGYKTSPLIETEGDTNIRLSTTVLFSHMSWASQFGGHWSLLLLSF